MATAIGEGIHASPWLDPRAGAQVVRAARFFMHSQVEAGHGCPITMTFAAIPALRRQPDLLAHWEPQILATTYDPRNLPADQKKGVTFGMAITEKQGGSDVRANTTRALPTGTEGPGQAYVLVGHKFFVTAPMCDAFLTLAQTAPPYAIGPASTSDRRPPLPAAPALCHHRPMVLTWLTLVLLDIPPGPPKGGCAIADPSLAAAAALLVVVPLLLLRRRTA